MEDLKNSMKILQRYRGNIPRYTSYPPASQFSSIVPFDYQNWLSKIHEKEKISLYFHIPFCKELCWFCGCHTKIVHRSHPVQEYLERIIKEIRLILENFSHMPLVQHIHFGGGSPNILRGEGFADLMGVVRREFKFCQNAELAVEIDPRTISRKTIIAFAKEGVTRLSLGVQDVNPHVQEAINRIQPYEVTAKVIEHCRKSRISKINIDLMYGLPFQTTDTLLQTIGMVLDLNPDRISLFGYAHVPWMKSHQRMIDEKALPDIQSRIELYEVASACLAERGYVQIGLDHFALPGDAISRAYVEKKLKRNFQGYTTDVSSTLLGFGASAISDMTEGYVQNISKIKDYQHAIDEGNLPICRGVKISEDDLIRRKVIENLMCYLEVDFENILKQYKKKSDYFSAELSELKCMEEEGIVRVDGLKITIPPKNRAFVRIVCAVFDSYLKSKQSRYSLPI